MTDKTVASTFYGKHYIAAATPEKLDKACSYLDMALRAEANEGANSKKLDMALNAACKAEAEGFGAAA